MSRSKQSSEMAARLARLEAEDRAVACLEPTRALETMNGLTEIATQAAARLNLIRGRDNRWRGRCPACGYTKPTFEVAVEQDRIAVSCTACGAVGGIAAMMGIPSELIVAPRAQPSKVARALDDWRNSTP